MPLISAHDRGGRENALLPLFVCPATKKTALFSTGPEKRKILNYFIFLPIGKAQKGLVQRPESHIYLGIV
jgi:hypothetical protein